MRHRNVQPHVSRGLATDLERNTDGGTSGTSFLMVSAYPISVLELAGKGVGGVESMTSLAFKGDTGLALGKVSANPPCRLLYLCTKWHAVQQDNARLSAYDGG